MPLVSYSRNHHTHNPEKLCPLFSPKNIIVLGIRLRSQIPSWILFVYVHVGVQIHSFACETQFPQYLLLCRPLLFIVFCFSCLMSSARPSRIMLNRRVKASLLFCCWPLTQAFNFPTLNMLFLEVSQIWFLLCWDFLLICVCFMSPL